MRSSDDGQEAVRMHRRLTMATCSLLVAIATLTAFAARSIASPPTTPCAYLSDSLVHDMALRLESASRAVVVHRSERTNPVAFKTAVPSGYSNRFPPAWARLDSAQAMGFVHLFDLAHRPPHGMTFTSACPRAEDRWDDVSLSFPLGADTARVSVSPASGEAQFTWRGCSAHAILADRATAFMNAVMEALPADTSLRSLSVCSQPARDSLAIPAAGFVEEFPHATHQAKLVYPKEARQAGIEGTVMVKALVGKDGRIRATQIAKSVPMLDEAAVHNVEAWEFEPAKSGGRPVAVWVQVPVKFTLH